MAQRPAAGRRLQPDQPDLVPHGGLRRAAQMHRRLEKEGVREPAPPCTATRCRSTSATPRATASSCSSTRHGAAAVRSDGPEAVRRRAVEVGRGRGPRKTSRTSSRWSNGAPASADRRNLDQVFRRNKPGDLDQRRGRRIGRPVLLGTLLKRSRSPMLRRKTSMRHTSSMLAPAASSACLMFSHT